MSYSKAKSVKRTIAWKFSRVLTTVLERVLNSIRPHGLSADAMDRLYSHPLLGDFTPIMQGMTTGDDARFVRFWHEISADNFSHPDGGEGQWCPYNKGGDARKWYGNCLWMLRWGESGEDIKAGGLASVYDDEFYKKKMVTWTAGASLSEFAPRYVFDGYHFDKAGAAVFPSDQCDERFLIGYLGSKVAPAILDTLKPNASVQIEDIAGLPWMTGGGGEFPAVRRCVAELVVLSKLDWDAYEHSWDFDSSPLIQAAYGKKKAQNGTWVLSNDDSDAYDWDAESKSDVFKRCLSSCHFLDSRSPASLSDAYGAVKSASLKRAVEMQQLEEENNRAFIDAYGLGDELTPEVLLKDITLTSNPYHRYGFDDRKEGGKEWAVMDAKFFSDSIKELISYAVGCIFGRYSIEMPGLILANGGEGYLDFYRKKLLSITDVLDEQAQGDRLFQKLERMGKMGRLGVHQRSPGSGDIFDSGRGSRGKNDKPLVDFDMGDCLRKMGVLGEVEAGQKSESEGLDGAEANVEVNIETSAKTNVDETLGGPYDAEIYSDANVELEGERYSFYINCQRFKDPENGAPNLDCPALKRCNNRYCARYHPAPEVCQSIPKARHNAIDETINTDEAMDDENYQVTYSDEEDNALLGGSTYNAMDETPGDAINEALNDAIGEMSDEVMSEALGLYPEASRYPTLVRHCPMSELHFVPCRENVMPIYAGEDFGDDLTANFKAFLRAALGDAHFWENLECIEDALGKKYLAGILSPEKSEEDRQYIEAELKDGGRRNASIRNYFLESFYDDHLKNHHNLPIYWMFSSPNKSFNALIYMHRYQPDTVAAVLDCLRASQHRLSAQISSLGAFCSDPKIPHRDKDDALGALEKLTKQLAELRNYDRDILAPLAEKRIEIDLNDGIKVNYAKFGKALKWVDGLSE